MKASELKVSTLCFLLLASLIVAGLLVNNIGAQPSTIYVNPPSLTKNVDQTFTIAVSVINVENLWAWQFSLSFNSTLLEALNVNEGEFLRSSGPTIWFPPVIDNVAGIVVAHAERTPPPPTGSSGGGVLAYIEFHCKGPGSSLLHLFDTSLWRPGMILISHIRTDGTVNQVVPPPQSLPLELEESVAVLESRNAKTQLSINVPPSPLCDMYRYVLGAPSNASIEEPMPIPETMMVPEAIDLGENVTTSGLNVTEMEIPVREEFYKSIAQEQEYSLGFQPGVFDSYMVPRGSGNETRVYMEAISDIQIINITKIHPENLYSDEIWELFIGPRDDNVTHTNATALSASYILSKIAFVQQMLGYLTNNQVFDSLWIVNIALPESATLLNGAYLNGLEWSIDFGGGTYMNASVSLGGPKQIILTERTFITEENVTAPPEYFLEAFSTYRKFKIVYQLPYRPGAGGKDNIPRLRSVGGYDPVSEGFSPCVTPTAVSSQQAGVASRDWSWQWSRTISPGSFTMSLSYSYLSASVTVTPSLTLSGYVGWEFKTQWWPPSTYLDWFKTYMSITPSVTVTLTASASASYTKSWDKTLYTWSTTYSFIVGPVPVWVTLEFKVTFTFTFTAQGTLSWTVGQTVSSTFKAGVKWTKSGGWSQIKEQTSSATRTGPTLSASASVSLTPELQFRLALLFYSVAGPFVAFIPYATITIAVLPSKTWSITLNFKITAGCTFADWLKSTLSLNDYTTTLYDWTLASWSGSW